MITRKVCPNPAHRSKILLECNSFRDLQPAKSSFLEKFAIEINVSNKFQQSLCNGKNNIYEIFYMFKHPNRYYQHDENYKSNL